MKATTLLTTLESRGVVVGVDSDGLFITAALGVLTDTDKSAIAERKPALLALLRLRALAHDCVAKDFPLLLRPTKALMAAHREAEAATGEYLKLDGKAGKRRTLRQSPHEPPVLPRFQPKPGISPLPKSAKEQSECLRRAKARPVNHSFQK